MMTVKSNVRFSDFPDYVEDTSVTATPVVNVFRSAGNVTMFEITNGSSDAWFQIFDSKSVTMSPAADQTAPVIEVYVKASTTLLVSCDISFTNAISYSATNSPGGSTNPSQTVSLTLIGEP
tara:strand:+ start:5949 stop:6311 length:363 start_codon:yes stop_codon:yes gene_type:complete